MSHPNPSTALARVVIDEMARAGARWVMISPGSRSGALAIAAAEHPELATRVVLDERSAAFHALGVARAARALAVVISTSGTAAANLYPAVVEADMSCVPLVVITADRPAELRGVGANQTIDQVEMFGSRVRGFLDIPAPEATSDFNRDWRAALAAMTEAAMGPRPGPIHLNIGFREPTVPVTDDGRTRAEVYPFPTPRLEISPGRERAVTSPRPPSTIPAGRGLVIAGDGSYDRAGLAARAAELGWPVLATALSGLRGTGALGAYHRVLAAGVPDELRPTTVVATGAIGPSPRLEDLISSAGNRIRVDAWGRNIDPRRNATWKHTGDPLDVLDTVRGSAEESWGRSWEAADAAARHFLTATVASHEGLTGAVVARTLNDVGWGALVVASSLPIREVDAHLERPGMVHANRGASGIDGFVSTALGVATVERTTVALAGDLSLLHDGNGFLHDGKLDLAVIVIDNEGGGLFDSLPPARHAPDYERLFVTPPHRDLKVFAQYHGLGYQRVETVPSLLAACEWGLEAGGMTLIHAPVDRFYDLEMRSELGG